MSKNNEFCLVYVTATDEREAHKISENAIRDKLVACANIGNKMSSIYWWKGQIEQGEEIPVIMKTTKNNYAKLEQMIRKNHSYENPCIIMLDIKDGSKDFLNWISEVVK